MSEDESGAIRMKSGDFVPWERYIPGDKAAEIWMKLHDTINENVHSIDSLSEDEGRLYKSLTKRIADDFSMVGYTVSESSGEHGDPVGARGGDVGPRMFSDCELRFLRCCVWDSRLLYKTDAGMNYFSSGVRNGVLAKLSKLEGQPQKTTKTTP